MKYVDWFGQILAETTRRVSHRITFSILDG
jgi:hypothetical protein